MSAPAQVLDYIQALIWPALIAVGVWVFRSQLRDLIARIKSVEAGGAKAEFGQVEEVLKESVKETREEVAKAEDPGERERLAQKLQREAGALGRVEAAREASQVRADNRAPGVIAVPGPDGLVTEVMVGEALERDRGVSDYLRGVKAFAVERGLDHSDRLDVLVEAAAKFRINSKRGVPLAEVVRQLGPPKQFVSDWIEEHRDEAVGQ